MGLKIETDIKDKINRLGSPPNAPSTVRRKGSDNPLVDTGTMRESLRYVVKTQDEEELGGD